jgi:Uma2 family endonuclease
MTAVATQQSSLITLSLPGKGMTDDEFFEFCQLNKNLKIERNKKGEIIIMSPTGGQTGKWNARINGELYTWNKKYKLGETFDSSTGFKLPDGGEYEPDGAWMLLEKWNALTKKQKEKFVPIVPDFILELRSLNDKTERTKEKIVEFMQAGCRLAWFIDPYQKQTLVYESDGTTHSVLFEEILTGGDILPGFEIKLSELLVE